MSITPELSIDSASATNVPLEPIPNVYELKQNKPQSIADVKIPYVLVKRKLMSPGVWNGNNYTAENLRYAFQNTVWDNESLSLYLDHLDGGAKDWIGEIKNPQIDAESDVYGDLCLVDPIHALKVEYGARFGISPKLEGKLNRDNQVCDAVFRNFSLVSNPACKTTFLNSDKVGFDGKVIFALSEKKEVKTMTDDVKPVETAAVAPAPSVEPKLGEMTLDYNKLAELVAAKLMELQKPCAPTAPAPEVPKEEEKEVDEMKKVCSEMESLAQEVKLLKEAAEAKPAEIKEEKKEEIVKDEPQKATYQMTREDADKGAAVDVDLQMLNYLRGIDGLPPAKLY